MRKIKRMGGGGTIGAGPSDGNFKGRETIIHRDRGETISLFYKTRAYTQGGINQRARKDPGTLEIAKLK